MPRPRKPTALLALAGALSKNPKRYEGRVSEVVDDRALGDPPRHLEPAARVAWLELERISAPGVLAFSDRVVMELAALHIASMRALGAGFPDTKARRLQSLLGELGLTPAARSRVTATRPNAARNPFASNGNRTL